MTTDLIPNSSPELLDVFESILPPSVLKPFDHGHARPFTSWMTVWLMVYQRTHQGASLSEALAEMILGPTSQRLPECKRTRDGDLSANTGAYSQARSDLPVEVAEHAVQFTCQALIDAQPKAWNGRPAFLIDGTTVTTGHYAELVDHFPPATNQHGSSHWPVILLVVAHELGSGLAMRPSWGPMYGPNAVSETQLASQMMPQLGEPAMIIYDRNFGIFGMTSAAVQAGHHVLARMTEPRLNALRKKAVPAGPGQWTLEWRPSRDDRKSHPHLPADAALRVRLIEITVMHQGVPLVLWLLTTDMTATPEQLAALYARRWDIEGDIRSVKQTLALDKLSCRSVEMVEKEILLATLAYNVVIQVRRLAAQRAGVEARDLSFARILYLVQAYCAGLGSARTAEERAARFERLLKAAARCRHPQRKKFRSYPREVIPRRRGFPERKREPSEQKI